jgi:steroid Delta-isomerase
MSTPEDNAKTVQRYLELAAQGNVEGIVDLYADDATVEDPVGSEVHIGRQAIHGFYSQIPDSEKSAEVLSLRTLGNEAAFYWTLTVDLGEGKIAIEIISTMTFTSDGKIASMKAYWSPENIKPVS